MRIFLPCTSCSEAGKRTRWIPTHIQEGNVYHIVCDVGHKSIVVIDAHQCKLLFAVAVNAVIDGYFREAVLSFSASLERFHEFYTRVISRKLEVPIPEYEKSRKTIYLSERELGAFHFAYLIENSRAPEVLSEVKINSAKTSFQNMRNKVAHQGFIPNRDQAVEFGNAMLSYAQPMMNDLKRKYSEIIFSIRVQDNKIAHEKQAQDKLPDEVIVTTSFHSSFSTGTEPEDLNLTIDSIIKNELFNRNLINGDNDMRSQFG